ncbi:MAG: DUF1232 domain-containing protein [Flavobacteriales bacterium]|nr:DUF1232 domain-containing protein [Flavobacteriales bacterium]
MKRFLIIGSGVLALIYMLNPTAGIFEIIPDNIPGVGNLDEGLAVYVLISVIAFLRGKDFGLFSPSQEDEEDPLIEEPSDIDSES